MEYNLAIEIFLALFDLCKSRQEKLKRLQLKGSFGQVFQQSALLQYETDNASSFKQRMSKGYGRYLEETLEYCPILEPMIS